MGLFEVAEYKKRYDILQEMESVEGFEKEKQQIKNSLADMWYSFADHELLQIQDYIKEQERKGLC